MTQPPRRRGEPNAPTKTDLQNIADRLADRLDVRIDGLESRINDQRAEDRAQLDAQQKVTREARAEQQARLDSVAEEVARQGRRGEEILATATRGYRTLEAGMQETKEALELRVKSLEERAIPEVEQIAEGVKASGREDRHRLAGLIAVGSGGTFLGICFWGSVNFISNHTKLVVSILHGIGFGLGKIPTPHE